MTAMKCHGCPLSAGFSLLELLVVLAIMAILGGVGLSGIGGLRRWTAQQESRALFHELQTACLRYRMENGSWPDSLQSGENSLNGPNTAWRDELAPYVEQNLREVELSDGFGHTDIRMAVDRDGDHWIRKSEIGDLSEADLWERVVVYSLDEGGRLVMASW